MSLIDDFKEYFDIYTIWRKQVAASAWEDDSFAIDHTENGFLQPRSGSYAQENQRQTATSTHIFYCYTTADIVEGDLIEKDGRRYRVDFTNKMGIGGISDHQEIELSYLDDLEPVA